MQIHFTVCAIDFKLKRFVYLEKCDSSFHWYASHTCSMAASVAWASGLKTSLKILRTTHSSVNVWFLYVSLRAWLTKLYTITLRCIHVFLYTEQAYRWNFTSPHTSLTQQLTKEHHQDHSLFLTESRGLCGAVPPFVQKGFAVQSCWMPSVSLDCKRPGESERRWGLRTDLRSRRSHREDSGVRLEWEPHKKFSSSHVLLGFSNVTRITL